MDRSGVADSVHVPCGDQKCANCLDNNFEFAFNVARFSDRTLDLQIIEDNNDSTAASSSLAAPERSPGALKRKRDSSEINAGKSLKNGHELVPATTSGTLDLSRPVCRIEKIYVSSVVLAAKSHFFREKFSSETGDSEHREATTLQIPSAKVPAFIDVIKFMYGNLLSAKTPNALLDIFSVAHEYNVPSCMKFCSSLLQRSPMTCEMALSYLSIPQNVRIADGIKKLVDAAFDLLPYILKDISKYQEAALRLPLDIFKALLSSDDLRLDTEDEVYDMAIKWARLNFKDIDERCGIFKGELCRLIRFPNMSHAKLKTIQHCCELNASVANDIVLAALFAKGGELYQPSQSLHYLPAFPCRERAYRLKPLKILKYNDPCLECEVLLDVKEEDCKLGPITTQDFHVGGECFYLGARRNVEGNPVSSALGLYLYRKKSEQTSPPLKVDCEFSVRMKNASKYVFKRKMVCTFKDDKALGFRNLLDTSWDAFIAEDSLYFIDGIFHLRAHIKVEQEQLFPLA